jgi:chorismate mutase/prephenate dehydratase
MKIYYLGPPASFTHQAALQLSNNLKPSPSIEDVLVNVKVARTAMPGIVPVENSQEGIVIRTLDLILENNLKVIAEINLKVKQNLLSKETNLKNIKEVYSHPHALAQVGKWLKQHLPKAKYKETSSSSEAAKIVKTKPGTAAIASIQAAKLYSLNILGRSIQDNKMNLTRFWVVAKKYPNIPVPNIQYPISTKTSIYIIIKDEVGALQNLLKTFAANHISLTSIQSRPLPEKPWQYGFFIDLLVDANDPLAKKMFNQLKREHPTVKILGAYPQTGRFNRQTIINYNLKRIERIFSLNTQNQAIKNRIDQTAKILQQLPKAHSFIKKIFVVRLMIIPSVALYKSKHQQKIEDPQREKILWQKMRQNKQLCRLYQQIIKNSKDLQAEIIKLLKSKKARQNQIIFFDIKRLRYYIDYLDTLALSLCISQNKQSIKLRTTKKN